MDELDQVDAVEPSEPDAAPVVESSPEPAEAPATEQAQEFDYEPDFLNDAYESAPSAPQPQHYEQQWSPQQVNAYNQYMRQQQQPQAPQESALDRLVRDTEGTIGSIAEQRAQMIASQMVNQAYAPMNQQMQQFVQGQARYHAATAGETIRSMYKNKFTKDETFASNDRVRARIDTAIDGLHRQAVQRAMTGDPSGFAMFSDPTFADVVLNMAKTIEGHRPSSSGSMRAPHVESVKPATQQSSIELTPDQEEAVRRMGPGGRERYIAAMQELKKHDDFEWDE